MNGKEKSAELFLRNGKTPIEDEHGFDGLARMCYFKTTDLQDYTDSFKTADCADYAEFRMRPSTGPFDRLRVRREQAHELALIIGKHKLPIIFR